MLRVLSSALIVGCIAGCGGGTCPPGAQQAAAPVPPAPPSPEGEVTAKVLELERALCACSTLTCTRAIETTTRAWIESHGPAIGRAFEDPMRMAMIEPHIAAGEQCRQAIEDQASPEEREAAEAGGAAGADEAIATMAELADHLCTCQDMACAEHVMQETSAMREPSGKPSKAQMERAMAIAEKMATCQKALMAASAPKEVEAEVALRQARVLALEAYPQFAAVKGNARKCPQLADLTALIEASAADDPWGHAYVVKCGAKLPRGVTGVAVLSLGADGREGTADDVRSWE